MSRVDPFLISIPKAFAKDPEVLAWATYLHRWCHDMWVRSGAGEDTLESVVDVIVGDATTIPSTGGTVSDPVWGENAGWQFFASP